MFSGLASVLSKVDERRLKVYTMDTKEELIIEKSECEVEEIEKMLETEEMVIIPYK